MTKIDSSLPLWLEDYHTLYPAIQTKIEKPWNQYDDASLTLAMTCPPIFEAYAIVFHPFWINNKGKKLVENGGCIDEDSLKDEDFKRVSWRKFFMEKGYIFSLETAFENLNRLGTEIRDVTGEWPEYCWFPGEGECETEELQYILAEISNLFLINEVNYHYNILRTVNWDKDLQYRGILNDFKKLPRDIEVWGNPSSIYPDDKSWYIGSNYDSKFTCVGGSKALIDSITQNDTFEIFELAYLVKPEK